MHNKENIEHTSVRLREAMRVRGLRQVELCEKTGIPKSSINQYLSGYAEPKTDRIGLLAKALDVDPVWLMGFDVPMETVEQQLITAYSKNIIIEKIRDNDDALKLAEMFTLLSPEHQKLVFDLVGSLPISDEAKKLLPDT